MLFQQLVDKAGVELLNIWEALDDIDDEMDAETRQMKVALATISLSVVAQVLDRIRLGCSPERIDVEPPSPPSGGFSPPELPSATAGEQAREI